jgi:apolipoprotein N-acyltransferase
MVIAHASGRGRSRLAAFPLRLVAGLGASAVLACAHPTWNAWPLAFLGLAGLFAVWSQLRPRAAALHGALAGIVYFALVCSWIGTTAGPLLGPFGFILDLGPALVEMPAFVFSAVVVSLLAHRAPPLAAAIGSAAAFAFFEWLRAIGVMGAPLAQIGMPFVQTPLAPIAAFAGTFGITFAVALVAAAFAFGAIHPGMRAAAAGIVIAVAIAALAAEAAWPARHGALVAPTTAAAVQGNIRQSVKWGAPLALSVDRYVGMTEALAPRHPAFVLWPETVITTYLSDPSDPENARAAARFATLARTMHTTLIVGTKAGVPRGAYWDSLYFFGPTGRIETVYDKRQLVPFAEALPATWLRGLPFTELISDFSKGTEPTVVDAGGLRLAPSICWETGFGDLIHDQLAAGAGVLVVSTDDAWFGSGAGPRQQAQISQMRAIESGRWVVRAAATGVSGIIAPDGHFTAESAIDTQTSVVGGVGAPRPTVYARIGPTPVAAALFAIVLAAFFVPGERRRP